MIVFTDRYHYLGWKKFADEEGWKFDETRNTIEFVKRVRERGVATALGSSSRNAERVLTALSIKELFDAVVKGHDLTRTKPDPQIFPLCNEGLGNFPVTECVVFEDAESGIAAALAAGMHAVGVGDADQLPNADQVIREYSGINLDQLSATGWVR